MKLLNYPRRFALNASQVKDGGQGVVGPTRCFLARLKRQQGISMLSIRVSLCVPKIVGRLILFSVCDCKAGQSNQLNQLEKKDQQHHYARTESWAHLSGTAH